jgi:hypothetical protein
VGARRGAMETPHIVRRLRLLPKSSRPRRRSGGHAGVVLTPRQLAPHVALSGPFACVQTADDCIAAQVLDVDSLGEAVIERSLYTPPFVCAAAASIIGPGTAPEASAD